nr:uncharacterized protein LOC109397390 [Aedes albopictus]
MKVISTSGRKSFVQAANYGIFKSSNAARRGCVVERYSGSERHRLHRNNTVRRCIDLKTRGFSLSREDKNWLNTGRQNESSKAFRRTNKDNICRKTSFLPVSL